MNQMQPDEHAERMARAIELASPLIRKLLNTFPYFVDTSALKELEESSAAWRKRK
jgi:sugar phosphate isomerase/epimerase